MLGAFVAVVGRAAGAVAATWTLGRCWKSRCPRTFTLRRCREEFESRTGCCLHPRNGNAAFCAVLCGAVGVLLKRTDAVKCRWLRRALQGGQEGSEGEGRARREDFSPGGFCLPFLGSCRFQAEAAAEGSPAWLAHAAGSQQTPVPSLGPVPPRRSCCLSTGMATGGLHIPSHFDAASLSFPLPQRS